MSALSKYEEELTNAIVNRRSIIYIQTDDYYTEEDRILSILKTNNIFDEEKLIHDVNIWASQLGKISLLTAEERSEPDLVGCLSSILSEVGSPSILVIRGLYYYFGGFKMGINEDAPLIISLLAEFANRNNKEDTDSRSIIIIESPKFDIPAELRDSIFTIEPPLPDEDDIANELGLIDLSVFSDEESGHYYLQSEDRSTGEVKIISEKIEMEDYLASNYTFTKTFFVDRGSDVYESNKKKLLSILKGMRIREIRTILSYNDNKIAGVDLKNFRESKERMVRDSGLLSVVEDVPENYYEYVGDIDALMKYIQVEKSIIDNRIYYNKHLPMPKGVLLIGPPGCGKSETSKAIASKLDMPLYNLDMGRLLGGLVGESEHNFENAIKIAEAAQPCVLRIDEIEKAFAGSGTNENDQTLTRIVGSFLTWMQERKSLVYIVATANNLDQLRPEFLRKGRWDEIFYLSYPTAEGMIKILDSCIKKYRLQFDDGEKVKEEIRKFYKQNNDIHISGAEIFAIVEQLYKDKFQHNPKDVNNNSTLSSESFLSQLGKCTLKDKDFEINKMIDNEILELKKEYLLKQKNSNQQERIEQAVEKKYTDDTIKKIIQDELISIKISSLMSNSKINTTQERKIETLLQEKYAKSKLIQEELTNIEFNQTLQNNIFDSEIEKEIRKILKEKYLPTNLNDMYQARGYKPASLSPMINLSEIFKEIKATADDALKKAFSIKVGKDEKPAKTADDALKKAFSIIKTI